MTSHNSCDMFSSSSSTSEDNSRQSTSDTENDATVDSFREAEWQKRATIDESPVQIRASASELRRRIDAFITSKKMEVSDNNIREFCFDLPSSGADGEERNSCARADAVFVSRVGSSSHMRVSRVHNALGPQTQARHTERDRAQASRSSPTLYRASVEERLRNAEQHLNIATDTKGDLFSRLKAVEEGILFLSGLSPEYFETGKIPQPKVKKRKVERPEPAPEVLSPSKLKTEYDSISEIDQRIVALKMKLKEKKKSMSS